MFRKPIDCEFIDINCIVIPVPMTYSGRLSYSYNTLTQVGNTIQRLSQLLPTDLQNLAHSMLENKFINMTQFSKNTHLNTVLISGLLYHIAVFLHHSEDNKFLKPLTSVHYTPTELVDTYLPSINPLTATNELQAPLISPFTSVPVSTHVSTQ